MANTINRAELTGIAAALTNKYRKRERKRKKYAGRTVKLLHRKKERKTNGDQEGCRLGLKPAPEKS